MVVHERHHVARQGRVTTHDTLTVPALEISFPRSVARDSVPLSRRRCDPPFSPFEAFVKCPCIGYSVSLGSALTTAILPVLSIAAIGFLLGSVHDLDVNGLSTVTIYVLTPALVFYSLSTTTLSGELAAKLVGSVIVFTVVMVLLAESVGRVLGESEPALGAMVLTSTFPNAGNYGIPLSAFAFGAIGRSTAVLFIAAQSVMMYTVGVYVASRGNSTDAVSAVKTVFELPLVYAVVAAGVAQYLDVVPATDTAVMETLKLTGDAAIPIMLLMLGIQLANTDYGVAVSRVGTATTLKLVVAPFVALGIVLAIGFENPTVARVFILECGMPAAITPLLLTIEFADDDHSSLISGPEYVSTTIFVTTLVSIPILTVLIGVLQSGFLF